jgi:hypothetical protein
MNSCSKAFREISSRFIKESIPPLKYLVDTNIQLAVPTIIEYSMCKNTMLESTSRNNQGLVKIHPSIVYEMYHFNVRKNDYTTETNIFHDGLEIKNYENDQYVTTETDLLKLKLHVIFKEFEVWITKYDDLGSGSSIKYCREDVGILMS